MASNEVFDVLIAGNGVLGCTLALYLKLESPRLRIRLVVGPG